MKTMVLFLNDCCGGRGGLLNTSCYFQCLWRNMLSQLCWKHHLINRTLHNMSSVSENISKQNSYYGNDTVKNILSRNSFKLSYIHKIEKTRSHVNYPFLGSANLETQVSLPEGGVTGVLCSRRGQGPRWSNPLLL